MRDTVTVKHTCGHTSTVELEGSMRDNERAKWKLEHQICDDCANALRQEKDKAAARKNADAGLPKLTGSEKQILWAEKIRADMLEYVDQELERVRDRVSDGSDTETHLRAMEEIALMFRDETDASWFISERNSYGRTYRQFVRVAMERDAEKEARND